MSLSCTLSAKLLFFDHQRQAKCHSQANTFIQRVSHVVRLVIAHDQKDGFWRVGPPISSLKRVSHGVCLNSEENTQWRTEETPRSATTDRYKNDTSDCTDSVFERV